MNMKRKGIFFIQQAYVIGFHNKNLCDVILYQNWIKLILISIMVSWHISYIPHPCTFGKQMRTLCNSFWTLMIE